MGGGTPIETIGAAISDPTTTVTQTAGAIGSGAPFQDIVAVSH
jgi:hypothetical protein